MALTYNALSTTTLGSNQSSISFTSISQSYTDLLLVFRGGMATDTGYALSIRLNGATGGYDYIRHYGAGSSYTVDGAGTASQIYTLVPANNKLQSIFFFHIFNYSNTSTFKNVLVRNSSPGWTAGGATGQEATTFGIYKATGAITSLEIAPEFTANLLSGSSATLYGIAAA